ncbi:DedA family protein [Thiomonas sp.]|jgi:membrane protein DedA with SNARE-associated domain|uniref:DedA family protein n=1 Tax=Thiomonas sp. TaxID=2047785 RepID=UPI0026097905|nr:DedA family protein [Thiomonas sp.]
MVEELVRQYGYAAVALGAFAEGETVLLFAGYGAQRGWLEWPLVVGVAALAATLGDQTFFFLGRWFGPQLLARYPQLQAHLPRVQAMLQRHAHWAIISVRFLYGMRIAGPVLIGVAGVPPLRFIVFNAIGALLWAPLITALGWFFGATLAAVAARVQFGEELLLAVVVVAFTVAWAVRRWRRRR